MELTKTAIGIGIAGTGFIGPAHIEGLRRNGYQIRGLSERTRDLTEKKAVALGIPYAYPSFEEMIADPEIHVVHLTTPNLLHYPQAKAALLAGKHVICEKPLTMDSSQSAELVALATERKLVNAINFNLRMYPISQQARSMVAAGEVGDIFILQGSYTQDWLLFNTDWNWRLEANQGGALRAVADIGSHWLDLVTFISGQQISEVYADFKTMHPIRKKPLQTVETFTGKLQTAAEFAEAPIQTEDYATILLHFVSGAVGVVTVSQVSAGRKNRLFYEINGSKSSLAWNSERPNELWIGHRDRPNEVLLKDPALMSPEARQTVSYPGGHNEGFPDTFKQFSKKVYDYILAGDYTRTPDFPTFQDGHHEMVLCEAIARSAARKEWVPIP